MTCFDSSEGENEMTRKSLENRIRRAHTKSRFHIFFLNKARGARESCRIVRHLNRNYSESNKTPIIRRNEQMNK